MMQSAKDGQADDVADTMYWPSVRRVFLQGEMSATRVVVICIFRELSPQMGFIPVDAVIEAFTPDSSDDAYCISNLPWAARRNGSVTHATGF